MVWCCAGPLPLSHLPVTRTAAGLGKSVRMCPGGLQRRVAFAGHLPHGRREDLRHRGSAPGCYRRETHPGSGLAIRGRIGGAGPGLSGCPPGLPELVRFIVRQTQGARGWASEIPVQARRQSVRLTRNGFTLRGTWLYIAKVGEVKVRWSRPLPSQPSSVTVIQDTDGRYYASFVLEREPSPLPQCRRAVGVDLGLASLAVTSDGEVIANPRFLQARQRHLARAQRALSRKARGSANRAKARRRVAVLHRKVREARLDHAHKTALRLVRDNQAVYTEDLSVAGLARTRLAKSVTDAGWSQLVRLIEEKAAWYGRTFRRIGRWEPTSQVCSACGAKDGPKPLNVRQWACAACGTVHGRDVNAARNILAAGQADRLNACGGGVRPGSVLAAAGETGTLRGAA